MSTIIKKTDEEKINPTKNTDVVKSTSVNPTARADVVTGKGYTAPEWSGGSGVGAKYNDLAERAINMNYTDWTEGTDYQSLAKRYSAQGKKAMDDTLGMVAARTGGLASSYATAAGNQAYNEHMTKLEDAARALYDSQRAEALENYNVSQGIYDRQWAEYVDQRNFGYQQYRDNVSDAQWADSVIYGQHRDNVSDAQWKDTTLTNQSNIDREWDYELTTNEQQDARDQAQVQFSQGIFPETEEEIAALVEATGWDAATITAYQTYYEDLASGEAAADATEESLEADSVLMDLLGSGMTWEEIKNNDKYAGYVEDSTFGEDYWTNMEDMIAEENTEENYTYANTEEGAENIVNMLINGASTTLNNEDIGNFDYIFGEGAYDAVQTFVRSMDPDDLNSGFKVTQDMNPELFEDFFNSRVDALTAAVPGLSYEQILDIIEKVNPNAYRAATDDTWLKYSSYEEWKNTPAG